MEFFNTIYFIAAIFGIGALIGMYLLSIIMKNEETPKYVAYIHGAFVGTGLILLFCYAADTPGWTDVVIIFCVAAFGGVTFLIRDFMDKPLPKWFAVGHGLIAITGFTILLIRAFS
ncbi:MAG TPA: hypothetical protein VNB90_01965 [Cytophagaceae bacterium]|jgi:hypothetical protein|nr:hypothetical protein [Cytophagaceae bacterium]